MDKKGIRYLLEALSTLPKQITLCIVDDGPPLKNTAFAIIKRLGLKERITFTGKVDNLKLLELYRTKTILIMPSLYEGFGLPAAEAMACKTPVIVTAAGALDEVVDESTGIIVQPGNAQDLHNAIVSLINNTKAQRIMGENGRTKVVKLFSWQTAALNTLNVYKDVQASFRRNV